MRRSGAPVKGRVSHYPLNSPRELVSVHPPSLWATPSAFTGVRETPGRRYLFRPPPLLLLLDRELPPLERLLLADELEPPEREPADELGRDTEPELPRDEEADDRGAGLEPLELRGV